MLNLISEQISGAGDDIATSGVLIADSVAKSIKVNSAVGNLTCQGVRMIREAARRAPSGPLADAASFTEFLEQHRHELCNLVSLRLTESEIASSRT